MNVVLLGRPGAGKGTQASSLADQCGFSHFAMGEILRRAADQGSEAVATALARGLPAPDSIITPLVKRHVAKTRSPRVFDGYPRHRLQAEILARTLLSLREQIDFAVMLEVGEETARSRLMSRSREDDTPETITERFRLYERQTPGVVDFYQQQGVLRIVCAEGAPELVGSRILAVLRG
jgi:adenylate kinase